MFVVQLDLPAPPNTHNVPDNNPHHVHAGVTPMNITNQHVKNMVAVLYDWKTFIKYKWGMNQFLPYLFR